MRLLPVNRSNFGEKVMTKREVWVSSHSRDNICLLDIGFGENASYHECSLYSKLHLSNGQVEWPMQWSKCSNGHFTSVPLLDPFCLWYSLCDTENCISQWNGSVHVCSWPFLLPFSVVALFLFVLFVSHVSNVGFSVKWNTAAWWNWGMWRPMQGSSESTRRSNSFTNQSSFIDEDEVCNVWEGIKGFRKIEPLTGKRDFSRSIMPNWSFINLPICRAGKSNSGLVARSTILS